MVGAVTIYSGRLFQIFMEQFAKEYFLIFELAWLGKIFNLWPLVSDLSGTTPDQYLINVHTFGSYINLYVNKLNVLVIIFILNYDTLSF